MTLSDNIRKAEAELHTAHCVKNRICVEAEGTLTTLLAVTEDAITRLGLELREMSRVKDQLDKDTGEPT
tara:strand:+ start:4775 stop:4981 length:207 start_codon:yes stop_codon:yes gene_type:complete